MARQGLLQACCVSIHQHAVCIEGMQEVPSDVLCALQSHPPTPTFGVWTSQRLQSCATRMVPWSA